MTSEGDLAMAIRHSSRVHKARDDPCFVFTPLKTVKKKPLRQRNRDVVSATPHSASSAAQGQPAADAASQLPQETNSVQVHTSADHRPQAAAAGGAVAARAAVAAAAPLLDTKPPPAASITQQVLPQVLPVVTTLAPAVAQAPPAVSPRTPTQPAVPPLPAAQQVPQGRIFTPFDLSAFPGAAAAYDLLVQRVTAQAALPTAAVPAPAPAAAGPAAAPAAAAAAPRRDAAQPTGRTERLLDKDLPVVMVGRKTYVQVKGKLPSGPRRDAPRLLCITDARRLDRQWQSAKHFRCWGSGKLHGHVTVDVMFPHPEPDNTWRLLRQVELQDGPRIMEHKDEGQQQWVRDSTTQANEVLGM